MLKAITLDGFKAFKTPARFELAPITVLAGTNSSGKSCVTGAIGALIQTEEAGDRLDAGLVTQGAWARLGRAVDVPNKSRTGELARTFGLELEVDYESHPQPSAPKITREASLRIECVCEDIEEARYLAIQKRTVLTCAASADLRYQLILERKNQEQFLHWEGESAAPRKARRRGLLNFMPGDMNETQLAPFALMAALEPDIAKYVAMTPFRDEVLGRLKEAFRALSEKFKANASPVEIMAQIEVLGQSWKGQPFFLNDEDIPRLDRFRAALLAVQEIRAALAPNQAQILSAYRIPPADLYLPRPDWGPQVGLFGEHIGQVLYDLRNREDVDIRVREQATDQKATGLTILNDWWAHILGIPGLRVDAAQVGRLGYDLNVSAGEVEGLKLYQVGAGLSQTLPMVASVCLSRPGQLLCIDTPEAHLHPAAQYRLTDLFVAAAKRNRRFLLETHSDHVVNRVCLAVKRGELTPDQVRIYFLHREQDTSVAEEVPLDETGRIQRWPVGFLDQSARELSDLME